MIDIAFVHDMGVTFTLSGNFVFEEVMSAVASLFDDKAFADLKYWMVDRTNAKGYNLSNEQAQMLAGLCIQAKDKNPSLVHIIVSGSELEFGMGRLFQVYEEETGWQQLSFRKRTDADNWLRENIHS